MTSSVATRSPVTRPPAQRPPTPRRRAARRTAKTISRYGLVIALALVFFFPFLAMVSTAFKTEGEIFSVPPTLLPGEFTLENFAAVFDRVPVWRYLGNTLVVAGLSVVGSVVSCSLVAYSLSKVPWAGARPMLLVVMGTMMLPPQVTMIPVYLIWNGLGAVGTLAPLIVPTFFGTPFLIYMIRQFLLGVPNDVIEAGRLDGASELRIFLTIVMPLVRPVVITAAVFQFVWSWTDFLNPLIYLNDPDQYTLSIGLYAFFGENTVAWGPLMAACVMFTLPAVVIFLICQRYFIGGAAAGAIK